MESEGSSLLCSQEPPLVRPDLDASSPHLPILFP